MRRTPAITNFIINQQQRGSNADPVSYTHLDVYKRQLVISDFISVYRPILLPLYHEAISETIVTMLYITQE